MPHDFFLSQELFSKKDSMTEDAFWDFSFHYQQLMLRYEMAIKCVTTRLEMIERECVVNGWHSVIRFITSRVKEPISIHRKLSKLGVPVTESAITQRLSDVAGVRVVCSYLSDIYSVRNELLKDGQLKLLREKDYIKTPKPNGYRSLHLIVSVPVSLSNGVVEVPCEIQLRTTAMDSWAALEHQLRYKGKLPPNATYSDELLQCAQALAQTDEQMQKIADAVREGYAPKEEAGMANPDLE